MFKIMHATEQFRKITVNAFNSMSRGKKSLIHPTLDSGPGVHVMETLC
jgi:hypothetical protein